MNVKKLADQLIIECGKYHERSGILTSAFKNLYMKEIKNIQSQLLEHPDINESIGSVTKLLDHDNADVRERAALIVGELFKSNRLDESSINKCLEKLFRLVRDAQKSMPDSVLRECVNALGKSGNPICESFLIDLLNDKRVKRIKMFVLVAIGKTGGEQSVEKIFRFSQRYDLRLSDIMFAIWAFGKLGGTNRLYGNPLPRGIFNNVLKLLSIIIQSRNQHHQIHLYSLFAIGEICDQRQTSIFADQIDPIQLKHFRVILPSLIERFKKEKTNYATQLIKMANAAIRMIQGEALSNEQERILLTIRNLLVPNLDTLEFNDTSFNIKDIADNSIYEQADINEIVPHKLERKSVKDFFKK